MLTFAPREPEGRFDELDGAVMRETEPPVDVSADVLRSIGLRLMRYGPPVGWLGAMFVMESNRTSARARDAVFTRTTIGDSTEVSEPVRRIR